MLPCSAWTSATSCVSIFPPRLYRELVVVPAPAVALSLVPQAWSLAIEVTVYAVAPFVFRRSVIFLLALLVASFVARTLAYDNGLDFDPWYYQFFPFEFGLFVVGSLLYRAYSAFDRTERSFWMGVADDRNRQHFALPGGARRSGSAPGFEQRELLFVIPFALSIPGTFALSKTWRLDRWIGELSYPIYLVHGLVVVASAVISDGLARYRCWLRSCSPSCWLW